MNILRNTKGRFTNYDHVKFGTRLFLTTIVIFWAGLMIFTFTHAGKAEAQEETPFFMVVDPCLIPDNLLCPSNPGYDDYMDRMWEKLASIPTTSLTEPKTIEQKIKDAAKLAGVDYERVIAISSCESNHNPSAVNFQGSSASGLFMFTKDTWKDGVKNTGLTWGLDDRFDGQKAIEMALWYMKRGEWSRWECDPVTHKNVYCAIKPYDKKWCLE